MNRDLYFRGRALLPRATDFTVTVDAPRSTRTPAHVRHPRSQVQRPHPPTRTPIVDLWLPSPECQAVMLADLSAARAAVRRADGFAVVAGTAVSTTTSQTLRAPDVTIDPGDYREPFTFARALGYAVILAAVVAAALMTTRVLF